MERRGLTGQAVADHLGVTPATVSQWRHGERLPSVQILIAYAALVGEPASWLIGDRLHGTGSIATLSQRLGLRLGPERLEALDQVEDGDLLDAVDLAIGRHSVRKKTAARRKAT